MKKTIIFVLVEPFADWEGAYLSSILLTLRHDQYAIKTMSLTREPIHSIGGFTILPDYGIEDMPADFDGVILIGGNAWRTEAAQAVQGAVRRALAEKKVLGAICDATVFLGAMGVLNNIRHTSNALPELKAWAKTAYTNETAYICAPAVRDGKIITANGTAALEFAREVLLALDAAPENQISEWYEFFKKGIYQAPLPKL
jgi:putative intracellular protease/amidase